MKTTTLKLEALTCPSCIKKIEGALKKQPGIKDARVLFNSSKCVVEFNEDAIHSNDIATIVEKLGYSVLTTIEK